MKILYALRSVSSFSYHESVIRALCRELRTIASYLRRKEQSEFYLKRWEAFLPRPLVPAVRTRAARLLLRSRSAERLLGAVERGARPDAAVLRWLEEHRPDVVVASPANMRSSEEIEYVKAAQALRIPTVVPVISWDNLTTKGLFHVMPDLLLAWNEIHLQDARQVHGIPSSRIVVTGSPFFDKWFAAERLLQDRESFCRKVGLSPEAPFLLYLGSTSNIATDETWLVQELARALAEHPHPRLRQAGILVRPHPVNAGVYDQLRDERVRVWPRTGALPDSQETISDFYNSMRHAVAAAGINTTGMIDAVVNDLPCLTVMAEQYSATQRRAVHFQYLLNADVLEVTQSPEECVAVLEGLLRGEDTRRAKRREFTRAFARPRGLERPAGEVVAQAILMAARGATAAEIEKALELEADPSPALR